MKISYILKATLIVIGIFIIFAFGIIVLPIGLGLLTIWTIACMFMEAEEEENK